MQCRAVAGGSCKAGGGGEALRVVHRRQQATLLSTSCPAHLSPRMSASSMLCVVRTTARPRFTRSTRSHRCRLRWFVRHIVSTMHGLRACTPANAIKPSLGPHTVTARGEHALCAPHQSRRPPACITAAKQRTWKWDQAPWSARRGRLPVQASKGGCSSGSNARGELPGCGAAPAAAQHSSGAHLRLALTCGSPSSAMATLSRRFMPPE